MPRIHQYGERYAKEDFQSEIRQRQGQYNLMSVRSLAKASGMAATTLGVKLKDPDKLEVADLRKLVATIRPDPAVILTLIGYTSKDIKQFKENNTTRW